MGDDDKSQDGIQRIMVSQETCDHLKKLFPTATYEEAISWLAQRYSQAISDTAACSSTELWIKMDRLEEKLSLLALSHIDIGDCFRRQVAGELTRMRGASCRLADGISESSGG